ncbi:MAG TPA: response regulator transcription factor [Polyangia bacterium]|jgi:DNA-binding NarL/FixJ family response regulator|nr:response regulator transcription factor [Polyangia bacterium]
MSKIRIVIGDDHAVLRASLRKLIDAEPDMEVVGEAADGAEIVQQTKALDPDVVLLDLVMPGVDGMTALLHCRRECPRSRILVLTMHDSAPYLQAAVAASAAGYVAKRAAATELFAAIRTVHEGRSYFSVTLEAMRSPTPELPRLDGLKVETPLSQREQQVLEYIAWGHTNQEIAGFLQISVKSVETYRTRLCEKLGLRTRAELVGYAMQTGLMRAPR